MNETSARDTINPVADPDRTVSEWVIAMGGNVKVSTAAAQNQIDRRFGGDLVPEG